MNKRQIEKQILDKRLEDFHEELIPLDVLPYLSCLQKADKEVIEATQKNEGPTRANYVLVDRIKRRHRGFQDFVQALRKCGFEHTALLLDPYYNYPGKSFLSIFYDLAFTQFRAIQIKSESNHSSQEYVQKNLQHKCDQFFGYFIALTAVNITNSEFYFQC